MSPSDKSTATEADIGEDVVAALGFEPVDEDLDSELDAEFDDVVEDILDGADEITDDDADADDAIDDAADEVVDGVADEVAEDRASTNGHEDSEEIDDDDGDVTAGDVDGSDDEGSDDDEAKAESDEGDTSKVATGNGSAAGSTTSKRSSNNKKKRKGESTNRSGSAGRDGVNASSMAAASVAAAGLNEEIKAKTDDHDDLLDELGDIDDDGISIVENGSSAEPLVGDADDLADGDGVDDVDALLDELVDDGDVKGPAWARSVAPEEDDADDDTTVRSPMVIPATTGEVPVVKADAVPTSPPMKAEVEPSQAPIELPAETPMVVPALVDPEPQGERPGLLTQFFGNPFDRNRQLQARKVRRVVRHIDPWSVLTFSVLFHMCVFAALLLASVLVWNVAESAGTIENLEDFILELGDYETFEINGEAIFRAAVAIAGILTLASSVMVVLLTVVFNLLSDLIGGIRVTVIEEETVRIHRKATSTNK